MESRRTVVGAYEAKTHLPELLERVQKGEVIVVTKHGVPVAELRPVSREAEPDFDRFFREMEESRRGENSVKPLVLDASIIMAWCFNEDKSGVADAAFRLLSGRKRWVPNLLHIEIANILLIARWKRILKWFRSRKKASGFLRRPFKTWVPAFAGMTEITPSWT